MQNEKFVQRDISWLSFNYRVLMEAADNTVPLLERLRFLAIYSSNLDEFFRVRVADIRNLIRIDKKKINKTIEIKPKRVLKLINEEVNSQLEYYGKILREDVLPALEKEGVVIYRDEQLCKEHHKEVREYFMTKVLAFLQPYVEGASKREAFLNNQGLYFGVRLKDRKDGTSQFGYLNIPSDKLPRFLKLSRVDHTTSFIMLDDVVRKFFDIIFPHHEVVECRAIKLNKDADLMIEDEYSGDLVEKISRQIEKRNLGVPSRFLYDKDMSADMLEWLKQKFKLEDDDLIPGGKAHNLNDYFQIPNPVGEHLEYPVFNSLPHRELENASSILDSLEEKDFLLHFPYQNYDYVLRFFNEAAVNPDVTSIYVAFYRMAANSLIGEALISAANNGKSVMVFMEVKARFDEENNLRWARRFQEARVRVVYSIPGLKVHAKIALVSRGKGENRRQYAFFGTGNLNEKTAKIYADHGLLTSDNQMTRELESVFQFLHKRIQPKPFKRLLVSQFNMMERFIELIDFEIEQAKQGNVAGITIKLNNLEEKTMISKLYEASQAGAEIKMIVRGICCLRPGVENLSEQIVIKRIVDRYLEHARAFIFHHAGKELIFLGSADWMNRNLHSRIEVTYPITSSTAKAEIKKIIQLQWDDASKATALGPNLENLPFDKVDPSKRAQFNTYVALSQDELY